MMKTYGLAEVRLHAFVTSGPDRGERSASRPSRFIPVNALYKQII